MTIWKKAVSVATSAALLASLLATAVAPTAFGAATVTVITGSPVSISADTTGAAGGTGVYTPLTGPALVLGAAGDVTTGNLVFAAPAGFEFNPAAPAPAPTESVGDAFTASAGTVTASTITYFVSVTNAAAITLTFTGWTVRPTAGTPLASGNLTLSASSTSTVNGVPAGSSLGTLTMVAGAASAAGSTLTASPLSVLANGTATSTLTATVRDQFGNPLPAAGATTLAQTGGTVFATVVAGASGNPRTFTASSAIPGTATFQATNSVGPLVITQTATVTFTAVAPLVFAASGASAVTTTGFGNVVRGGSSAAGTFTLTEGAIANFVGGTITVTPFSSTGVSGFFTATTNTASVMFDPAFQPTATVTAGIGAVSASVSAGGVLTITISDTSGSRIDNFTVSGLRVRAGATAALGAVQFRYLTTDTNLGLINATASGTLAVNTGVGVQSPTYTLAAGSPEFQVTATGATPPISNAAFTGPVPASVALTAVSVSPRTVTANFTVNHPALSTFSQTVQAQWFPTGAAVVDTTRLAAVTAPTVLPGVNNQDAGNLTVALGDAGFVPAGATLTFAITTPGVRFSALPLTAVSGGFAVGTGVLSLDRTSIVYTVTSASTGAAVLTLSLIKYDVALAATAGAWVNVSLAISGGVAVAGSPAANAQIGPTIIGVGAVPTIIIGHNDQPTGLLTIRETAAGTLPDDTTVATDRIFVCITSAGETFSRAPWFVRTAGNITFNVGGLAATQARATLTGDARCAFVRVFSASTVASTIEVRAGIDAASTAPAPSGPTAGATVNVAATAMPGPTLAQVSISALTTGASLVPLGAPVVVAMRALAGTPIVAAVSQPFMQAGALNQAAGNITIAEGATGNFAAGQDITLSLVDRALTRNLDTFFANIAGVGMPIVSTNNAVSGLVAHLHSMTPHTITVRVLSPAIGPLGVITISGIRYNVNVGTASGPVLLRVGSTGTPGAAFDAVVSNAMIGVRPAITIRAATALGQTRIGPFTTPTKTAALNRFITWRFSGGSALAGKRVQIWIAVRNPDGTWGTWSRLTGRTADGAGNAFFWTRYATGTRISVRAFFPGDATHRASWSRSGIQGVWR